MSNPEFHRALVEALHTIYMTPAERRRWWGIHGATINGSEEDKFAQDLAARGLIQYHDGMANANYWLFTEVGRLVYFGVGYNE